METVSFKLKHPITSQEILLGQGIIGTTVMDLGTRYLVDKSALNLSYFRRTGKTFFDAERGLCEYLSLLDLTTEKTVNPEIGWVYVDPKPGFENIKGFLGFFKQNHEGLIIESSARAQEAELK